MDIHEPCMDVRRYISMSVMEDPWIGTSHWWWNFAHEMDVM